MRSHTVCHRFTGRAARRLSTVLSVGSLSVAALFPVPVFAAEQPSAPVGSVQPGSGTVRPVEDSAVRPGEDASARESRSAVQGSLRSADGPSGQGVIRIDDGTFVAMPAVSSSESHVYQMFGSVSSEQVAISTAVPQSTDVPSDVPSDVSNTSVPGSPGQPAAGSALPSIAEAVILSSQQFSGVSLDQFLSENATSLSSMLAVPSLDLSLPQLDTGMELRGELIRQGAALDLSQVTSFDALASEFAAKAGTLDGQVALTAASFSTAMASFGLPTTSGRSLVLPGSAVTESLTFGLFANQAVAAMIADHSGSFQLGADGLASPEAISAWKESMATAAAFTSQSFADSDMACVNDMLTGVGTGAVQASEKCGGCAAAGSYLHNWAGSLLDPNYSAWGSDRATVGGYIPGGFSMGDRLNELAGAYGFEDPWVDTPDDTVFLPGGPLSDRGSEGSGIGLSLHTEGLSDTSLTDLITDELAPQRKVTACLAGENYLNVVVDDLVPDTIAGLMSNAGTLGPNTSANLASTVQSSALSGYSQGLQSGTSAPSLPAPFDKLLNVASDDVTTDIPSVFSDLFNR